MTKELSKYIQSLFSKFRKHARHAAKEFDVDEIHKMRVNFKKIEAVFNLLHFFSPENSDVEEIKKAKKSFKKAGKARELHLMMNQIDPVHPKNEEAKTTVLDFLKEKEEKAEKKFQDYYTGKGENEMDDLEKKMVDEAKKLHSVDLMRYFKDLLERVILLQSKNERTEDELHQLRKLIKELGYNIKLLGEEEHKKIDAVFPLNSYKRLEKQIGDWHDETIFLSGIEKAEAKLSGEIKETDKQSGLKRFFPELHNESEKILQRQLKKIERSIKRKNSGNAPEQIVL